MPEITTNVAADGATVVVREIEANVVELQAPAQPAVVEVVHPGPQGPPGASSLAALEDVNTSSKVNQSVLYYDSASGKWKGDSLQTILTVADGGNFAMLAPLLALLWLL